jgi:hypothetical protein
MTNAADEFSNGLQRMLDAVSAETRSPPSEADLTTLRTFAARYAEDLLRDYERRRNIVHFWRAWQLVRRAQAIGCKLEMPAGMLQEIDRFVTRALDSDEHLEAIKAADDHTERRELMQDLLLEIILRNPQLARMNFLDRPPKVPPGVYKIVAARHGIKDPKNLRRRWHYWWREPDYERERRGTFAGASSVFNLRR